ncbi:MAG: hypothetical protein FJ265_01595 [Planctomycetes bacterium]|nr:hypothetical protein [Planctomycetota bacterium]
MKRCRSPVPGLLLALAACQTPAGELGSLADAPPLDCAVLVTGGAFLQPGATGPGTFGAPAEAAPVEDPEPAPAEPIPMADVLGVLGEARVFRRVEADAGADGERRRAVLAALTAAGASPALTSYLQEARDRGFDLLLVVEGLQDGPIESQGVNGRWPVTLVAWILLGLGVMIPDHSFESRATLRVTLRDLQTGRVLYERLLVGGPIDLSLSERGDWWGLVTSILVPPFWVGDDPDSVRAAVRAVVERRLLVSLAGDLKSESARQGLRRGSVASLSLAAGPAGPELVVEAAESLSVVRLRAAAGPDDAIAAAFASSLLGSMQRDGERFRYRAALPAAVLGQDLQVLVGTIRGGVASGTFAPGGRR